VAANLGRLAVISTPIGNLGDLSPRARDELASAELIAAEDTRRTGQLLTTLGLARPLVSLHEHNENERIDELLTKLRGGMRIALVSDAGTPLLSDPGFELVRRVSGEGMSVVAVPGPSAITAALSIAGLPTERFTFEGFLPARLAERRARLAELAAEARTQVFFEAPHRITESLEDMSAAFGQTRRAAVARELTKVFETVYRGTLAELAGTARRDANFARGEITVVVEGAKPAPAAEAARVTLDAALTALLPELSVSKAAAVAAKLTGAKRNDAYTRALELAAARHESP
jgi:16S rRNA (cytidine1402-2'-O)-methyltransferase